MLGRMNRRIRKIAFDPGSTDKKRKQERNETPYHSLSRTLRLHSQRDDRVCVTLEEPAVNESRHPYPIH